MDFRYGAAARGKLRAHGVLGAAGEADWHAAAAPAVSWDDLFACTGLFGIELGTAQALAGQVVELRGFMTPPMEEDADYFVLSRSPLPNCPFCAPSVSWPDDIAVVHLRTPGVDIDHPMCPAGWRMRGCFTPFGSRDSWPLQGAPDLARFQPTTSFTPAASTCRLAGSG